MEIQEVPHYYIHANPGALFGNTSTDDDEMAQLNIFEGETTDLVATFFGVKPFEFSYSRLENGALEVRHIENIDDYQYKLRTGRQGIYKILAIKDKYCGYSVN